MRLDSRGKLPVGIPIRAVITQHRDKVQYTLHLSKVGDRLCGCSVELTEEQVKRLKWWY